MKQENSRDQRNDDLPFSPWIGCLVAILVGVLAAFLVVQIARLAFFGEIRLGGPSIAPHRIWYVQDADNAGIMASTTRVVAGSMAGERVCLRTSVHAFLWRRDESNSIGGYCLCYERIDGRWSQQDTCQSEGIP